MNKLLPALAAVPLLIAFGILEGFKTERWGASADLVQAAARLGDIPLNVGEWRGLNQEMTPQEVEAAKIRGYLYRRYQRPGSEQTLTVLIVCGRPGPIAVHSPDICYRGAGYILLANPSPFTLENVSPRPTSFWVGRFALQGASIPEHLRILWAWTADGHWTASEKTRLTYARSKALYKMYVVRETQGSDEPMEGDPAVDFLNQFLPQIKPVLFQ